MSGIKISQAILAINPTAQVGIKGDDLNTCEIRWFNGTAEISKADIQAKLDETAYMDKRESEYPSLVDQLDDIYHNGIDGWKATIKITKDKYPKS